MYQTHLLGVIINLFVSHRINSLMHEGTETKKAEFDRKHREPNNIIKYSLLGLHSRRLSRKQTLAENGDSHLQQRPEIFAGLKATLDVSDAKELEKEYEGASETKDFAASILDRPRGIQAQRIRKQRQAFSIANSIKEERERERDKSIRRGLWMPKPNQEPVDKARQLCMLILNKSPAQSQDTKETRFNRLLGKNTILTKSPRLAPAMLREPQSIGLPSSRKPSIGSSMTKAKLTLANQEDTVTTLPAAGPDYQFFNNLKWPATQRSVNYEYATEKDLQTEYPLEMSRADNSSVLPEDRQGVGFSFELAWTDAHTEQLKTTTSLVSQPKVQKAMPSPNHGTFSYRETSMVLASLKSKAKMRELLNKGDPQEDIGGGRRIRKPLLRALAEKPMFSIDPEYFLQRPASKAVATPLGLPEKSPGSPSQAAVESARKSVRSIGLGNPESSRVNIKETLLQNLRSGKKQSQEMVKAPPEKITQAKQRDFGEMMEESSLHQLRRNQNSGQFPLLQGARTPLRQQVPSGLQRSESPSKLRQGSSKAEAMPYSISRRRKSSAGLRGNLSGWDDTSSRLEIEPGGIEELF